MKLVEEDMTKDCLRKDLDWMLGKMFFSNRVIDNWNTLPASCVNFSSINTFKNHLSSELELEAVKLKVCTLR